MNQESLANIKSHLNHNQLNNNLNNNLNNLNNNLNNDLPLHPTQSLSPPLRTIRRSFELLSISYFLNTFASILSIQDFSISKLEADLDGSLPDSYTPSLIPKLLVALTGDRTTNHTNWESRLRREFLRREPHVNNPLGEEPAKLKSKLPKRAVGYVYIAEPIPLSSIPSIAPSCPQPTQLVPSANDLASPCQPSPSPSHTSTQSSCLPQPLPASDQLSNLPAVSHPRGSPQPPQNHNQSHPVTHQPPSTESTPSLHTQNPDQYPNLSESIQPRQAPLDSSSTPAPNESQNDPGTTKTWSSLSPTVKLRTLFKLCEWHFGTPHDLERFRRLVDLKTYSSGVIGPDDRFDLRQEPLGIDSLGNQYWLAGQGIEARLWIQRREPQPPRKSITLRIPARPGNKRKSATFQTQKRHHPAKEQVATSSSTPTTQRSSNSGPLASKRPRLTGTRSSSRLRATPTQPPPTTSTPPRPPTMIKIKKSSLYQPPERPRPPTNHLTDRSTRPSPRQRGSKEVWQDVPPGWLEQVVAPASNNDPVPPVFSSDLSEMSDDEEEEVQTERNTSISINTIPKTSNPISSKSETNNNYALMLDESLSELTESQDASTVVTCDSISSDSDTSGSDAESDDRGPTENSTVDPREPEVARPLAQTSSANDVAMVKRDDNLTGLAPTELNTIETSCGLDSQMICENEQTKNDSNSKNLKLDKTDLLCENGEGIHPFETIPSTNSSDLHPTVKSEKNSASSSADQQSTHLDPLNQTDQLPSQGLSESSALGNAKTEVKSTSDEASNVYPEMKGHPLDPDWIEWEVICSNLDEWKQFSSRFQNSECQSEKKLNECINREILPELVLAYEAEEARIQKEEAMAQRKRSIRLSTREAVAQSMNLIDSEMILRESTRMHSSRLEAKRLRELEMEEANRQQKEEDQRLTRLKEREEKVALKEAQLATERDAELKRAERARLRAESKLLGNAVKVARAGAENSVPSFNSDEQWRLNCEICGATGINMDDGNEVICCDVCEDWQHLTCHDKADEIMKKPKRDWSTSDFLCSNCSGIPIPRAVGKLKTYLANGKPKIRLRPSSLNFPKNHYNDNNNFNHLTNFNSSNDPVVGNNPNPPVKSHKLTILMSNPNKLGGSSLSQVVPNSDRANGHEPLPSRPDDEDCSADDKKPKQIAINDQKVPETCTAIETTVTQQIPTSITSATNSTASISPVSVDISMYYNDLEKLRRILITNSHLQRSLPDDVMKRLRSYLQDQQKQQHQRRTQDQVNHSDNFKRNDTSSSPMPRAVSNASRNDKVILYHANLDSSTPGSTPQDELKSSSNPTATTHISTHCSSNLSDSSLSMRSRKSELHPPRSTFIDPQLHVSSQYP